MSRKLPASVTDTLLHMKDSDSTEEIVLPITRYKNILNAPRVVNNIHSLKGAPFILYKTDSETLSTTEIRKLVNSIF